MKVKNLNSHIEHIINGYKQEYACYKRLLEISVRMEMLVQAGDADSIKDVLGQRQEIIDDIKELDQSILSHRKAVMEILHLKEFNLEKVQDLIYPNLRKELDEQTALIRDTIEKIIATDRKNEETINKKMSEALKELKSIQQHFDIQQAYLDRPERFPEPKFFDKKK